MKLTILIPKQDIEKILKERISTIINPDIPYKIQEISTQCECGDTVHINELRIEIET